MTAHEFAWTLIVGIVIGWNAHNIILQIAYRLGIVEYCGRWNRAVDKHGIKGDAA